MDAVRGGANPFEVLELDAGASPMQIERQKHKLLGMLELGLEAAATYATGRGPQPRTAESVREAAELLARPTTRLAWELWTPRAGVDRDSLDDALELHAAIDRQLAEGLAVSGAELDELGLAWDLAIESEDLEDRIDERVTELGAGDREAALDTFTGELEASLLAMTAEARVDIDELESEILARVADRHTGEILERLELACERYVDGPADIDRWSALTRQYWDAVKGRSEHVRGTAFYTIYGTLSSHAVELHNERGEYESAAREFRWLAERAEAVGDEEAATRERQNAELASAAWLRNEQLTQNISASTSTSNSGGSWHWAWLVVVVVIAMLRASRGCASHREPSYTPPPIRYDFDSSERIRRINQELQRSIDRINRDLDSSMEESRRQLQRSLEESRRQLDQSLDEINRDFERSLDRVETELPAYDPLPPPDPPAETTDDRRTPRPPAAEADN